MMMMMIIIMMKITMKGKLINQGCFADDNDRDDGADDIVAKHSHYSNALQTPML